MYLSTVTWHLWNGELRLARNSFRCHARTMHMATREAETSENFLQVQDSDCECQAATQNVGILAFLFPYEGDGVFVQQELVDGALQIYVPVTFCAPSLYRSHQGTLAGHLRGWHTYDTTRHPFFRLHGANDVHTREKDCRSCARPKWTQMKHEYELQTLPDAELLESAFIDILDPLSRKSSSKQHLVTVTDWYSNFTRAITTGKSHRRIFQLYSSTVRTAVWYPDVFTNWQRP